jgi:hypothetical protein
MYVVYGVHAGDISSLKIEILIQVYIHVTYSHTLLYISL